MSEGESNEPKLSAKKDNGGLPEGDVDYSKQQTLYDSQGFANVPITAKEEPLNSKDRYRDESVPVGLKNMGNSKLIHVVNFIYV